MKRSGFKPRKTSLRDSYAAKLKREGTKSVWNRNGKLTKRKPLKKVSRSQRERLKRYYTVRNEFLAQPENQNCRCCTLRRESGENIQQQAATENHHSRGRGGSLLFDTRFFVPVCYDCSRNWIHQNPSKSREMGLLSSAAEWNTPAD